MVIVVPAFVCGQDADEHVILAVLIVFVVQAPWKLVKTSRFWRDTLAYIAVARSQWRTGQ
jgi:hypothetical protein